jgi:hypothetical protein
MSTNISCCSRHQTHLCNGSGSVYYFGSSPRTSSCRLGHCLARESKRTVFGILDLNGDNDSGDNGARCDCYGQSKRRGLRGSLICVVHFVHETFTRIYSTRELHDICRLTLWRIQAHRQRIPLLQECQRRRRSLGLMLLQLSVPTPWLRR